jgi:hypothetical protein
MMNRPKTGEKHIEENTPQQSNSKIHMLPQSTAPGNDENESPVAFESLNLDLKTAQDGEGDGRFVGIITAFE